MVSSKTQFQNITSERESNMSHFTPAAGKLRVFIYGSSLKEYS
jgi:hypothetical protein